MDARVSLQVPVAEPAVRSVRASVAAVAGVVWISFITMGARDDITRAYSHLTLQADQNPANVVSTPPLPPQVPAPPANPRNTGGTDHVVPASVPAAIAGIVEESVAQMMADAVAEIGQTTAFQRSNVESRANEWNEIGPLSMPGAHVVCLVASGLQGAAMAGTMDKITSVARGGAPAPKTLAPTPITKTLTPVSRPTPKQISNLRQVIAGGTFRQSGAAGPGSPNIGAAGYTGRGGYGVTVFNAAARLADALSVVRPRPDPEFDNFWGSDWKNIVDTSLQGSELGF